MQIEILFIAKDEANKVKISDVKQLFRDIFDFSHDRIQFDNENSILCVFNQTTKNKFVSVELTIDGQAAKHATILSELKNIVQSGSHRRNFHILISYDESSNYYCNKLFYWLSQYERKLRHFIYITIINALGNRWVEGTIEKDKDLEKSIKKSYAKNKEKMIEDALEEFDFSNYDTYLFTPYPDVEPTSVIEETIEYSRQNDIEKENIIRILNQGKAKSLWERYFKSTEIENLQDNIHNIRKIRNSVMHNKQITHEDFKVYKSLLRNSITLIDKAIIEIKTKKYYDSKISDVYISFKNVTESLRTIAEPLAEIQKVMQNALKSYERTMVEARKLALKHDIVNKPLISPALKSSLIHYQSIFETMLDPLRKIPSLSYSPMIEQLGEEEQRPEHNEPPEDKINKSEEKTSHDD